MTLMTVVNEMENTGCAFDIKFGHCYLAWTSARKFRYLKCEVIVLYSFATKFGNIFISTPDCESEKLLLLKIDQN